MLNNSFFQRENGRSESNFLKKNKSKMSKHWTSQRFLVHLVLFQFPSVNMLPGRSLNVVPLDIFSVRSCIKISIAQKKVTMKQSTEIISSLFYYWIMAPLFSENSIGNSLPCCYLRLVKHEKAPPPPQKKKIITLYNFVLVIT